VGDTLKIGRRGSFSAVLRVTGKQGHVAYPHLAENPVRGLITLITALHAPLDAGNDWFPPSNLEIVDVSTGNPAFNVIPGAAEARLNVRFNSDWTLDSLEAELRRRLVDAAGNTIRWELMPQRGNSDSFLTEPGGFVAGVAKAVEGVTGRAPQFSTSGGTSDARFITRYGPVIELGLVGKTMHQVDEHVVITELEQLTDVYRAVLAHYFRTGGGGAAGC
jgi:succinyl-diaminopimelate desuccinylase